MGKGSPGGILLIAAGVLFLRLAYTGRIGAVWQALISGESSGSGTDVQDQVDADNAKKDSFCGADCFADETGRDCPDGYTKTIKGTGKDKQQCCCPKDTKLSTGSKAGQANGYHAYNAAGMPYVTSAGNNAYA